MSQYIVHTVVYIASGSKAAITAKQDDTSY